MQGRWVVRFGPILLRWFWVVASKFFVLNIMLNLPTPSSFPAFPFNPPYEIQVELMRHLYSSIEDKKVTIIESPTGTVSVGRARISRVSDAPRTRGKL